MRPLEPIAVEEEAKDPEDRDIATLNTNRNVLNNLKALTWNVLMGISVLGAVAAAATAIYDKVTSDKHPEIGMEETRTALIAHTRPPERVKL